MDTNESLSYIAAVFRIDEAVLTNAIFFIVLAIVFIGLLLFLGIHCFKKEQAVVKKSEGA
jgi:hypothetical protein